MNMSGKTGIESRDLRQVGHHIVDPAECMWGAVAVADTGVSIMFSDDEVGIVLCKPLAEGVIVVFSLDVREVDPGVARHASIQVGHEDGDVQGGVTRGERTADEIILGFAGSCGFNVNREQVESGGGKLQQDLESTAFKEYARKDATCLIKKLPP
jgi:hypothetical protein